MLSKISNLKVNKFKTVYLNNLVRFFQKWELTVEDTREGLEYYNRVYLVDPKPLNHINNKLLTIISSKPFLDLKTIKNSIIPIYTKSVV